MEDLNDRCSVVTGAASGIGFALSRQFADEGMKVVMADVEEAALDSAASDLTKDGARVLAVTTDVSKQEQVDALAERAASAFGNVHVLCNNAGVTRPMGTAWEQSHDDWQWVIDVNLWGVIHGVRSFIPAMLAHQEEGHVVITSSAGGLLPSAISPVYSASKAAVGSIAESLAEALSEIGAKLGVTLLCPGGVQTKIFQASRNRPAHLRDAAAVRPEIAARFRQLTDPNRGDLVEPDYIARAVVTAIRANQLFLFPMQARFKTSIRQRLARIDNGLSISPDTGDGPA
jgi:NAD(P)-dependent dehydrogenase (short-subunit alcohol dehydrogenase family)